ALGTVSVVSGNLVTLGPTPQGAELVVGAELNTPEDIAAWTAGTAQTTISQVTGGMRVAATTAAIAYAYQAVTTVVGRSYAVTVQNIGTAVAFLSAGTTPGGTENSLNAATTQAVNNGTSATFTFVATATTTYISLRTGAQVSNRDFGRCSIREAAPFSGFAQGSGTLVVKYTAPSSLASNDTLATLTDRYGSGGTINTSLIQIIHTTAGTMSLGIRDGNVAQTGMAFGSIFLSSPNTVAAAWALNDMQIAPNGEWSLPSTLDTSGTMPPWIDRIHIGHINGGSLISGTLRRITYFARRVPEISLRETWYDKFSDVLHILGDSFTGPFTTAFKAALPTRKISSEGVGGRNMTGHAAAWAKTPALRTRTLLVVDGSGPDEDMQTVYLPKLGEISSSVTSGKWLYVQGGIDSTSTPATVATVMGSYATVAAAIGVNYVETYSWMQTHGTGGTVGSAGGSVWQLGNYIDTLHPNTTGAGYLVQPPIATLTAN
ncbi:hypothetical protein, partial [Rhizobium sp. SGZ-381]|uniref:hypothetical protein n=1 Tax=Rhizobium sp. SGZ-381 TaxID=3342800 RepID=UPI00366FD708